MKKNILLIFFLTMMLSVCSIPGFAQTCEFEKEGFPVLGGAGDSVEMQAGTMRKIKGQVVYGGSDDPARGAAVVVYKLTGQEEALLGWQWVDEKGKFCFRNLPAGKYHLKIGLEPGIRIVHIYLTLLPESVMFWRKLKVGMSAGI